ncbi:putative bifunctional diguanylate cyclase/phosphodiesterase [Micromonospora zhanjiangensis]|uniref:Bifunctional diguanylate cyclase/phosphodiesterase n=1 Tax=Micromonospora zhanjiangensis TaxID=1522057 RepID=A0ABV8KJS1_9ACTN
MPALPAGVLGSVLDVASAALVVVSAHGETRWRNRAAERLLVDLGRELTALPLAAATPDGPPVRVRCPMAGAPPRYVEVSCRRLPDTDLLYELTDITERRADRHRADTYQWRLSRIEQLSRVGTWEWDPRTQEVVWSPTMRALLGFAETAPSDYATYRSLLHPDDVALVESTLERALRDPAPFAFTHRIYLADRRTLRILECFGEVLTDQTGTPVRVLGTAQDVTETRRVQEELAYLAEHDPLTGLPNRRALTARIDKVLDTIHHPDAALLLIDIDNFKDINDLRGHAVGDEVLRLLAQLLATRLEPDAMVARLGGDEFAVLLGRTDGERALAVATGLCDLAARTPLLVRSEPLRVTLSIGAALLDPGHDHEQLLAHADLALYQAKGEGRDRARLFSPEQQRQAALRVDVVSRVRRALDEGRLRLAAQPIIDLADEQPRSYELLVRMPDDREPRLTPADFLPALERGDMVCELDRWVVEQAVGALAFARAAGAELRLDVNVSGRSLENPDFGEWVVGALRARSVPATQLGLEITETTAIANLTAARRLASVLTSAGCRFSLDDFGAGYGSFVYLKHLPFSEIKIDGEFVRQADRNSCDRVLIDAVVRAAHGLGMGTVAEHIDRPELVPVLRTLGVDRGQGFHLGRPLGLDELVRRSSALAAQPTLS